jgi:hypothetical protein
MGKTTLGPRPPHSLYSLLMLSLGFAFDAESGDGPHHQSLFRNGPSTRFANAERSIVDPIQGLLDLHDQFSLTILDSQEEVPVRFQTGSVSRIGKVLIVFLLAHAVARLSCFLQQNMESSLKQPFKVKKFLLIHSDPP